MEIMNSKNSFDPTPRLISSPIQIWFFPFSIDKEFCDCGNAYSNIRLFQKYCKNCSSEYIKKITNFNAYLDIYDGSGKQNITLENSSFKQIVNKNSSSIKCLNYCKFCCYERSAIICSVCYLISFTWIEFTSTFPVLHLPWWDTHGQCIVCNSKLISKSNCQKWCSYCIIIYTGCRYCLTTNIIFGITENSQCKKCKRLSFININTLPDVKNIREYFLRLNTHNFNQIANYVNNIDENSKLLEIYSFIKKLNYFPLISILLSHIANLAGNNENSLYITIPIMFIPFNNKKNQCYCCKKNYSKTLLFDQKYCKNCLQWYIKYATSNTDSIKTAIGNLDVCIRTTNTNCDNHKPRNLDFCIREWCENCSEILYFKQIVTNQRFDFKNMDHFFKKNRKKSIYKQNVSDNFFEFKLYSNYYSISFEFIESTESTLVKNHIPILHLPWWDAHNQCIICNSKLKFKSNCQKWCSNCFIIYTGCRYCLTTNIIFGNTEKSQCMKCKRLSLIDINMKNIKEHFLKLNTCNYNQITNYVNNIDKHSNLLEIYIFLKKLEYFDLKMYSQTIEYLENNGDYSIMPIMFIPFINDEDQCYCCKNIYSETLFKQKYCKDCLYWCIKYATSNLNIKCAIDNLDVCVRTTNNNCDKHEPKNLDFCIQGWCENCTEILYFKQIVTKQKFDFSNLDHFNEETCRLCKKLMYKQNVQDDFFEFELCSNCYSISFEFIESTESTLVKNHIPILHLPWWDAHNQCIICNSKLKFKSNCQKWCSNCFIIYTGCRYCLTTNIIFGNTEKSQCMKCKRLSLIDINMKNIKEHFLKLNTCNYNQITNYVNNIDKHSNLLEIYIFLKKLEYFDLKMYSQTIEYLENNGDYSIMPIMFIPFINDEDQCYCCKNIYSETLFKQKYCKDCLYWCIKYATSNLNIKCAIDNLDVCVRTTNNNCDKHEPKNLDFCIQGWCENCTEILYFKQIVTKQKFDFSNLDHFNEETCRLCKKLMYKQNVQDDFFEFELCSNCYSISFEFSESILILYLPWWDARNKCMICHQPLKSKSSCQKYCSNCLMVYTGCRFCLTTNIIFGYINQSQCKRCKRIEKIASIDTIDTIVVDNVSGNSNIDEFLNFTKFNMNNQVYDYVNNINKNSNPLNIYKNDFALKLKIEWVPYSRITNLKEIAEGGYGKIYKASINGNIVAVKEFLNSQDPSKYFLNEVIILIL
ncbi:hypothetical protein RhiirC2_856587 [Rhizophagus irregularis]|uniref:Protein kinase domain-containing protein n=1 Tax=Rhizophagus irregularis TaxID=588596 RepID=A0A2N1MGZ9_9GLOM|nr:hypothetical protein RhiirC2_856587 [Rhizophagus irregularis]